MSTATVPSTPHVQGFWEARSGTVQYIVSDPHSGHCAIIDPVLDFDEKSGSIATRSADALLDVIDKQGLALAWILDTHPHADHLSATHYLAQRTGVPMAMGAGVLDVQRIWKDIYGLADGDLDQRFWDRLFVDGDTFTIGSMDVRVMFSPGHTAASITYVVGDAAFIHDTLFMPDGGSARADFPGADARTLWRSIQGILALPPETRLFTGHDYQPGGREPRWESRVADQLASNTHVVGLDEEGFVAMRESRDKTLPLPKLMLFALQVNLRGGRLPEPEGNGRRYLRIPLDAFDGVVW
jgi:glyoxylase-like metal-dependent hydrolase (beta-lactamase superfamily II)